MRCVSVCGILLTCAGAAHGASPFVDRLEAGQHQTVVLYGTSLTAGGAWTTQLSGALNARYPGQITWINSGLSGKASNTGVANLNTAVLAKQPDAVFVEFGMNDAFTAYFPSDLDYDITLAESRANLEQMIDAIQGQNPACQIVLQTTNPAWDLPSGMMSGTKRPQLDQYYQGYRDVAKDRDLLLIDNNIAWIKVQTNTPSVFASYVTDGTHPTAAGWAQVVTPAIKWQLGAADGLTLVVDPASGRAVLCNRSTDPIDMISYTVNSPSGALLTTYSSLADQNSQHGAWFEAQPSTHNLSELNPAGSLTMAVGAAAALGVAWDPSKALDLSLSYQTLDGQQRAGAVVYSAAAATLAVAGDFDANGQVDGHDFIVWQRGTGLHPSPYTGADGNGDGRVDGDDLALWLGALPAAISTDQAQLSSVPEPSSCTLAVTASLVFVSKLREHADRHGRQGRRAHSPIFHR